MTSPLPGELGQRGRDGRAARRHQIGEDRVGQRQRQPDALGAHPAPAVGQMPEQHVQTDVDARLVHDRHVDREVARALQGPVDEPAGELRISGEAPRGRRVEQRQPNRLEHLPAGGQGQRGPGVLALPRAQQVAHAEQLGAEAAVDPDPPQQQALEHQQPDPVAQPLRAGDVPAPAGHPDGARDAVLHRPGAVLRVDELGEVGILAQDVADAHGSVRLKAMGWRYPLRKNGKPVIALTGRLGRTLHRPCRAGGASAAVPVF